MFNIGSRWAALKPLPYKENQRLRGALNASDRFEGYRGDAKYFPSASTLMTRRALIEVTARSLPCALTARDVRPIRRAAAVRPVCAAAGSGAS